MLDRNTREILPEDINFTNAKWYIDLIERYEKYRFNLLRILLLATACVPVFYIIIDLLEGVTKFLFNYSIPCVISFLVLIALAITKKTDLFSTITLIAATISFVFTLYAPNAGNVSLIIFFCFPPVAFQLSGTRRGAQWIALFAVVAVSVIGLSISGLVPPLPARFPSYSNIMVGLIATIFISVIIYSSERQHEKEINAMIRSILLDETTRLPNRKALLHSIKKNSDYLFAIIHIEIFTQPGLVPGPDLSNKMLADVTDQLKLSKERFNYVVFSLEGKDFGILFPLDSNDKEEAYRKMASIRYYLLSTAKGWENSDLRLNILTGGVVFHSGDIDKSLDMLYKAEMALKTSIDKNTGVTLVEVG